MDKSLKNNRTIKAYLTIGHTFGTWIGPIVTGLLLFFMRQLITIGLALDKVFYSSLKKEKLTDPIVIVGNPRSGTTFLHRYLINMELGSGAQLWQLIYPSIILQKFIRPILPLLELISPARHHSTDAHQTSLRSIETDDVSLFFRYFDGFFLYGFLLSFADEDLFDWFDPKLRNTSQRDFRWLEAIWMRTIISSKKEPIIGKLFSLSTNLPAFMERFPDSKIINMVRDPVNVLPSGLSLVTGVLDKRFGFWSLPKNKRDQYIDRLYTALVELLKRFHDDYVSGRIERSRVFIVRYDRMMDNFEDVMSGIFKFTGFRPSDLLIENVKKTAENQRQYISKHAYDLKKFGLDEERIRIDCSFVYETFLNE